MLIRSRPFLSDAECILHRDLFASDCFVTEPESIDGISLVVPSMREQEGARFLHRVSLNWSPHEILPMIVVQYVYNIRVTLHGIGFEDGNLLSMRLDRLLSLTVRKPQAAQWHISCSSMDGRIVMTGVFQNAVSILACCI